MKYFKSLLLLSALSACSSEADQPTQHIYRYPEGTPVATTYQPGMHFQGGGVIVDYRNHALAQPKEEQRWVLEPNAFLLVAADGTIMSVVPARYSGKLAG